MNRHRLLAEDGISIVEIVVALAMLMGGVLALLQATLPAQRAVTTSELLAAKADVAEEEVARIVALGHAGIGLSSVPSASPDPTDPTHYIQTAGYQWDWDDPSRVEELCTATTGCTPALSPGPDTWTSEQASGHIYRFVTWVNDPCDPTASPLQCTTSRDYKRITIAVTQDTAAHPANPFVVSTIVADPAAVGPN